MKSERRADSNQRQADVVAEFIREHFLPRATDAYKRDLRATGTDLVD